MSESDTAVYWRKAYWKQTKDLADANLRVEDLLSKIEAQDRHRAELQGKIGRQRQVGSKRTDLIVELKKKIKELEDRQPIVVNARELTITPY